MKIYTIKDIRELCPRHDPSRFLGENWKGTVLDILELEGVPPRDRIWVAVQLLPKHIVEYFVIDCVFRASSYAATADAYVAPSYADTSAATCAAYAAAAYTAADAAAAGHAATTARHTADASASAAACAHNRSSYSNYAAYAAAASAAAATAKQQERENQIDSLILLMEMGA